MINKNIAALFAAATVIFTSPVVNADVTGTELDEAVAQDKNSNITISEAGSGESLVTEKFIGNKSLTFSDQKQSIIGERLEDHAIELIAEKYLISRGITPAKLFPSVGGVLAAADVTVAAVDIIGSEYRLPTEIVVASMLYKEGIRQGHENFKNIVDGVGSLFSTKDNKSYGSNAGYSFGGAGNLVEQQNNDWVTNDYIGGSIDGAFSDMGFSNELGGRADFTSSLGGGGGTTFDSPKTFVEQKTQGSAYDNTPEGMINGTARELGLPSSSERFNNDFSNSYDEPKTFVERTSQATDSDNTPNGIVDNAMKGIGERPSVDIGGAIPMPRPPEPEDEPKKDDEDEIPMKRPESTEADMAPPRNDDSGEPHHGGWYPNSGMPPKIWTGTDPRTAPQYGNPLIPPEYLPCPIWPNQEDVLETYSVKNYSSSMWSGASIGSREEFPLWLYPTGYPNVLPPDVMESAAVNPIMGGGEKFPLWLYPTGYPNVLPPDVMESAVVNPILDSVGEVPWSLNSTGYPNTLPPDVMKYVEVNPIMDSAGELPWSLNSTGYPNTLPPSEVDYTVLGQVESYSISMGEFSPFLSPEYLPCEAPPSITDSKVQRAEVDVGEQYLNPWSTPSYDASYMGIEGLSPERPGGFGLDNMNMDNMNGPSFGGGGGGF